MRINILILHFLLFLVGITKLFSQPVTINLQEPSGDSFIESVLFSEVSFVALGLENTRAITEDMEMKFIDNNYFILDNRYKKCVYRFDAEGKMLNTIGEKLEPSQTSDLPDLNNPVKFTVDPYAKHVEIFNFEDFKIQRYSYTSNKLDKVSINLDPADFIRDRGGNYWIYTGWNNKENSYRLLKMDSKMNPLEKRMRMVTKCTPIQGYSFYDTGDGICLWELLGNEAFKIVNDKVIPTFLFDFGVYQLPENYHNLLNTESLQLINNNGYFTVKKYLENNDFAYFFLNFSGIDRREMLHVIYQKSTKKISILEENAGIAAFDKAHALTNDNELIFLVSPRRMRQLFKDNEDYIPEPFLNIKDSIGNTRTTMVLKIKLQPTEE